MKKLKFVFIFLIVVSSCSILRKQISIDNKIFKNQEQELEYYYAFTEATKLALFGNYKDAINLYNQCLKYNPKSSAVYYQLSNIFLRLGQVDMAKNFAKMSVELENNNKWYLQNLASIYQLQHNLDSTILIYKRIVELDNSNINYQYNLALLYKENKEYRNALKLINKIIENSGLNDKVIYFKYNIYELEGKKKKAIAILRSGINHFPDNINIYGLLAEYYSDIGKNEEAQEIYKKIVTTDSTNYKVILSYADFLINNNNPEEAFKYYENALYNNDIEIKDKLLIIINLLNSNKIFNSYKEKIILLTNDLCKIYNNDSRVNKLAVDVFLKADLLNKALDKLKIIIDKGEDNYNDFEKLLYIENALNNTDSLLYFADVGIKKYSDRPDFYLFKGIGLMKMKEDVEAINTFKKGIMQSKNDNDKMQFYNYLGEGFRNLNENDSSDYYFEKALNLDPGNLLIRNNYAYYLSLRKKNLDRAKKLSELTIRKEPKNAIYLDTYSWILFQENEPEKALKYIEMAVKFSNEKNPEILDHYGDILFRLNKYSDALNVWKSAYNIDKTKKELLDKIEKSGKMIN